MVTLDQLHVLSTLADAGSFAAAAARLHRAQSAVSYAVRMLESELGVALFDRSGHRARLTAAGESLLRKGREVLDKTGELAALAEALRGGWEPRLTLLLDGLLPVSLVLPRLEPYACGELPSQLSLRVELLGGVLDALERERPDLAIIPSEALPLPRGYASETLGEIVMLPVAARAHPLAGHKSPVPLEELRRHVHLIVSDSTRHRAPMDAGLIGAARRWSFPDFTSRLEGLRAGLGFAWMPTYMVEADLLNGRLVALVLEEGNLVRARMGLVQRTRPPLGRAGRMLLETLRAAPAILPSVPEGLLARYGRHAKSKGRRGASGAAERRER